MTQRSFLARMKRWLALHLKWCWCQVVGHKPGGGDLRVVEGNQAGVIEMCARCTAPMNWRAYSGKFPQPRGRIVERRP
jgi:hypothetical protein